MKGQLDTAIDKLRHALTFVREAEEARYHEIRQQQLSEAARNIEFALGVLENHGENQTQ